jgi:subtilisin family serine protease
LGEIRYIAKCDKSVLNKLGVESEQISADWQVFNVADTALFPSLRQAGVYIERDQEAKICTPNDSLFPWQWGMTGNNLWNGSFEGAWTLTDGSEKIKIGVLDTGSPFKNGIWTHPDLDSNRFVSALNFVTSNDSDATVTDYNGHSTHIVGIISAKKNNNIGIAGIDQHCQIAIYKVFSMYGSGWYSGIAQGIYRAVHDSCKILSMSFGGIMYSRLLEEALTYTQEHNIVCVATAGNDAAEMSEYPAFFGRFCTKEDYRSGLPNIISVGAIDDFGSIASYSNRGWFVDIYAPGGSGKYPLGENPSNVLSTMPTYSCILGKADSAGYYIGDSLVVTLRTPGQKTYGYLAGTSMAVPFVTGTVSLMLAVNPNLTPEEVRNIIIKTADVIMTTAGPVPILNPGAAVRAAKYGTTLVSTSRNLPSSFTLNQNYPNPFNPTTTISYQIPAGGLVTLKVYYILGREVTTLVNETKNFGTHEIKFDASTFSSGVYIYKITAGNFVQTKKMILTK